MDIGIKPFKIDNIQTEVSNSANITSSELDVTKLACNKSSTFDIFSTDSSVSSFSGSLGSSTETKYRRILVSF